MDWNVKKNWKYLLGLAAFCGLIPHAGLAVLKTAAGSGNWAPVQIRSAMEFLFFDWLPFWAVLITYLRVQNRDNCSVLPMLACGLILPTFLPYFPGKAVAGMAWLLPLMLAVECTGLLNRLESARSRALSAIGADRKLLRAFLFWSVTVLLQILVTCNARTAVLSQGGSLMIHPFLLIPVPGLLIYSVMRYHKASAPSLWSVLLMLAVTPVSAVLVSTGYMAQFRAYHLLCLLSGFFLLFLMLVVWNADRWARPKTAR